MENHLDTLLHKLAKTTWSNRHYQQSMQSIHLLLGEKSHEAYLLRIRLTAYELDERAPVVLHRLPVFRVFSIHH